MNALKIQLIFLNKDGGFWRHLWLDMPLKLYIKLTYPMSSQSNV